MKRVLIATTSIAAVVALVAGGVAYAGSQSSSGSVVAAGKAGGGTLPSAADEVRSEVQAALDLHQRAPVPPSPAAGEVVPAAVIKNQLAASTANIHRHFAAGPADKELKGLQNASDMETAGNFKALDGGTKNLKFKTVTVNGTTATATATVETWSRMSMTDPGTGKWQTFEPHNQLDVTMTLAQLPSGEWQVQTFDWTFVPGTGP